jgi:glycerophosphoryl diester phosphodiesterase
MTSTNIPPITVFAHRGASFYAPENTLPAFEKAYDMGAVAIECDVMISRDGVPFIFHDLTLKRIVNQRGYFYHQLADTLAQLDAGKWFGQSFIGIGIPTLAALLAWLEKTTMTVNLELKSAKHLIHETVNAVFHVLKAFPNVAYRCILSSFDDDLLFIIKQSFSGVPIALLRHHWSKDTLARASELHVNAIHAHYALWREDRVQRVCALGLIPRAYTVNDASLAIRLAKMGVMGIFSDKPDVLTE